jgi:hypothetical protein
MAGKDFGTDEDKYSAKPWNWKDWCLFVAFPAFAALTLYWGIHDYERVSYDHPPAQLGSMKSIMVGCVFAGISLLAVLLLCRQLLLGVPYLILDANGIVYRDVWGPCQRAKWSSLDPIELVVVGTKGCSNFAQAAVINSDVTATSVSIGTQS